MSVKNSRVRRIERRAKALERFHILPKEGWQAKEKKEGSYEEYLERKNAEREALKKSI